MSLELNYFAHMQELMDIVNDFVDYHIHGEDINDPSIQDEIFDAHLFDELTDYDMNYIRTEVERRI